jgi:hypothetical protein
MTATETLLTLSRMMAALKEHNRCSEITYECGAWKTCHQIHGNGSVTVFYKYPDEPASLYPLKVTLFGLGRSYVTTIQCEKELCPA